MTQVFPSARLLQPVQARLLTLVVEPLLTPSKVPRCADRILVVTVRSATARRRVTAPLSRAGPDRFPHRPGREDLPSLIGGSRVPHPSLNSPAQATFGPKRSGARYEPALMSRGAFCPGQVQGRGRGSERLARLPSLRWLSDASGDRSQNNRRAGTVTAPTWFLTGGRRKPPWSRTKLGEWSPRDEKGLYNWPGRENL